MISVSFSRMCRHFDLWNRLTQRHLFDKGHLELKVHLYWLENESYDVRCRETENVRRRTRGHER